MITNIDEHETTEENSTKAVGIDYAKLEVSDMIGKINFMQQSCVNEEKEIWEIKIDLKEIED